MERIDGAILAAGRGERLRAQGVDLPKPLVTLGGETLLARQARTLHEAGADRIIAVVNSETAALIERDGIKLPQGLSLGVRDTPNSMETLFELGEHLATRWFLAATVDAILARGEMKRFAEQALALVSHQPPSPPSERWAWCDGGATNARCSLTLKRTERFASWARHPAR